MKLKMAVLMRDSLWSAAQIVCAIVNNVEEVGRAGCLEVNGKKAAKYSCTLENQGCGERVLHLEMYLEKE